MLEFSRPSEDVGRVAATSGIGWCRLRIEAADRNGDRAPGTARRLIRRSSQRRHASAMSDTKDTPPERLDPNAPIPFEPPQRAPKLDDSGRPIKPRLRKLRIFSIVVFLGILAVIATLFG